ncbi:MAG: hypothetical protein M3T49_05635 [Candidatus Eremiobacteraeota bacterium]|nr:hypothetical protein [Candidatus Eremiobacteraeota bacterium]
MFRFQNLLFLSGLMITIAAVSSALASISIARSLRRSAAVRGRRAVARARYRMRAVRAGLGRHLGAA